MMTTLTRLALVLTLISLSVACKPQKPEAKVYRIGEQGLAAGKVNETDLDPLVLAEFKGYQVTAGELRTALQELPTFQRHYYSTVETVKVFLMNYIMLNLLADEAVKAQMDNDPYVRFVLETELARKYRESVLADKVKASDVSDEEVKAYMAAHPEVVGSGSEDAGGDAVKNTVRSILLEARREEAWKAHVESLGNYGR